MSALEKECKEELLREYRENGNDRKRSPMFGKEAGYIGIQQGRPSEHVTRFQLVDPDAFVDWMDEAPWAGQYARIRAISYDTGEGS